MSAIPSFLDDSHRPWLAELLQQTTIAKQDVTRNASKALEQCENVPGFSRQMMELVFCEYDETVQHLAAIQVHHIVRRHWASRGAKHVRFLEDGEKLELRNMLLDALIGVRSGEVQRHRVVKRLAMAAGDMARLEWARGGWQDLFPTLSGAMQETELRSANMHRVMLLSHYVVKELATIRIPAGRRLFASSSATLLPTVIHVWRTHSDAVSHSLEPALDSLRQSLSDGSQRDSGSAFLDSHVLDLRLTRLSLKVLRRLVPRGPVDFFSSELAASFWPALLHEFSWMLRAHRCLAVPAEGTEAANLLDNLLSQHSRLLYATLEHHGVTARPLLFSALRTFLQALEEECDQAGRGWWAGGGDTHAPTNDQHERGLHEPLALGAVLFVTKVLDHEQFQTERILAAAREQATADGTATASGPLTQFLGSGAPSDNALSAAFGGSSGPRNQPRADTAAVARIHTPLGDVFVSPDEAYAVESELRSFFDAGRTRSLVRLLVLACCTLTRQEEELWHADPETYFVEEERSMQSAEHSLRASAHRLLLELVERFPDVVRPALLEMLHEFQDQVAATIARDPGSLFTLDSILQVMGIASFTLHDDIDFGQWLHTHLAPILESVYQAEELPLPQQVVLSRVLWLVSCWINDVPESARPDLYQVLVAAIGGPSTDRAVKLVAAQTLYDLVHDFAFERSVFAPYYPQAVEALFSALRSVDELTSREKLTHVLTGLTRMAGEEAVRGCAGSVLEPLPALWEACASQNIVRRQILAVLKEVVAAMGLASVTLQDGLAPVIQHAVDVNNPELVFLAGDGVELWLALLENSQEYTEVLDRLFPFLPQLLPAELDVVPTGMELLSGYFLMGGESFLQRHSSEVGNIFARLTGSVRPESGLSIVRAVEQLLRVAPVGGSALLESAGVLEPLLHATADSGENVSLRIGYLSVLARILVVHPAVLSHQLGQLERSSGAGCGDGRAFLTALVDMWIDLFDSTATHAIWTRSLWALALARVVGMAHGDVLARDRIDAVLNSISEVVAQEQRDRGKASAYIPGMGLGDAADADSVGSSESEDGPGLPAFLQGSAATGTSPADRGHSRNRRGRRQRGVRAEFGDLDDDDDAFYGTAAGWHCEITAGVTAVEGSVLAERQKEAFRQDVAVSTDLRAFAAEELARCEQTIGPDAFASVVGHVAESTIRRLREPREHSTPPRL